MAKKLSTQEILAKARAAAKGEASDSSAAATPPAESPVEPSPAPPTEPAASDAASSPPVEKPKSTKDILAAARAQAKGGGAPAQPASSSGNGEGKPKSTKDILAAARAQTSGGGGIAAAKPAAAKPAATATATKAAPAVKAGGKAPTVQEMVKAIAAGKKAEPATAPKPAAPRLPRQPVPAKAAGAARKSRRSFLSWFGVAWVALTTASVAGLLGMARFMFPNVLVEPPSQFKIGPPSDFPFGTVSTKFAQAQAVWIVHTNWKGKNLIYALSTVCTHLGCTPNWLDGEQKFKCPCHGSGFYITGINFEGPAPRPLERHGIRIAPDGELEVDKSVKFQEELGQWESPESFVEIV